jgi:hypothetical protein
MLLNIDNVSDAAFAAAPPAPPTTLVTESAADEIAPSAAGERGGNFTVHTPIEERSESNKGAQSIIDMKQLLETPTKSSV